MEPVEMILDNTNPINQEIHIEVPDGYEIDEKNSTFKCIKLKPINKPKFSDYDGSRNIVGFFIDSYDSTIKEIREEYKYCNFESTKGCFATEKQAKSALAMAQISQIMANDERFGGVVTDKEWNDETLRKFVIDCTNKNLFFDVYCIRKYFLAFHTVEQRDLFLKENEQLVKDYLMID